MSAKTVDPSQPSTEVGSSLNDMPTDIVEQILSFLSPTDLASVSVKNRRLKDLASCPAFWEKHCKARWPPFYEQARNSNAAEIDWQAEFRTRAVLSPSTVSSIDIALAQCDAARTGIPIAPASFVDNRTAFEAAMKAAFHIGAEVQRKPALLKNPLTQRLQQSLSWWLSERQEVAVAFVREANRVLQDFDMWRMAFINWPEIPWRRSAVAFLPGLVSSAAKAWDHVSVLDALERETDKLDAAIKSLKGQGDNLAVRIPEGIPDEHWWYRLE